MVVVAETTGAVKSRYGATGMYRTKAASVCGHAAVRSSSVWLRAFIFLVNSLMLLQTVCSTEVGCPSNVVVGAAHPSLHLTISSRVLLSEAEA